MIENNNAVSRDLEKALQALEQVKQRVANEKKKQNAKITWAVFYMPILKNSILSRNTFLILFLTIESDIIFKKKIGGNIYE